MASVSASPHPDSASGILDPAWHMRWRVPEVALVLGDRAVALARRTGDQTSRLSAEALAVFASNRLGHGVAATGRALAAVREAESAGHAEILTRLRIELAWCAVSAGSYEVALRVLRGELERNHDEPGLRAHALLAVAAALPGARDADERTRALDEAERLYAGCSSNRDVTGLLTARVRAARAGHLRKRSEFDGAIEAAESGLELLDGLTDPDADGGGVRARLELDRIQSLLDLGRRAEALEGAHAALGRPVRAAEAGPIGWLGLAVATRVHLPAGDYPSAVRVLADTVAIAERHDLDCLLAETLNVLSHAHESMAEVESALRTLRESHSADRRWRSDMHDARMSLLAEFPAGTGKPAAAGPVLSAVGPEQRSAGKPRRRRRAAPEAAAPEAGSVPEMPAAAEAVAAPEQRAQPEAVAPAPEPSEPEPFGSATAEQQSDPSPSPEHERPATSGRRHRGESIEPDWANFLGLAVDDELARSEPGPPHETATEPEPAGEREPEVAAAPEPGAAAASQTAPEPAPAPEPEPVSVEQQVAEHISAEKEASATSGYAATQDAARKLLETLTSRAEEAGGQPEQAGSPENAAPSEPAEPVGPEDAMPEPRVEFAGLGDQPPWLADRSSRHAEPGADEVADGRYGGGERGYSDPLAAASDNLRWITSEVGSGGHEAAGWESTAQEAATRETTAHELVEEDTELPDLVDDDRSPEAGEPRATATSLLEQVGLSLASYGFGPRTAQPEASEPEAAEQEPVEPAGTVGPEVGQAEAGQGADAADEAADDGAGGRRSRGKSLAQIRAELELPSEHRPSRRRRYAADEGNADDAETSADPQAEPRFESAETSLPEPEPEPSSDARLADLLAEAMKAYEVGNRDDTAGPTGSRRDGTHRSAGVTDEPVADPARSTSDDSSGGPAARHRRPGFDAAAADPLL